MILRIFLLLDCIFFNIFAGVCVVGVMSCTGTVNSLVNCCLYSVAENMTSCKYDISMVPTNIKERMLNLLCKRGLVTDSNIEYCVFRSLGTVDLSECLASDKSLKILSQNCSRLVKIDLNATKGNREEITSAGVVALSKGCCALRTVYLRRCIKIDDEAIVELSKNCPHLRQLNVGGCPLITDQSLKALGANSEALESLNVSGTAITDCGVKNLCDGLSKASLNELHINNCLNLTDESVNCVTTLCPSIKILLLHNCPKMTDATRSVIDELSTQMRQVTWTFY